MTAALDSPVAKNCHTISCSNIRLYAGHLPVSVFPMTILIFLPSMHCMLDLIAVEKWANTLSRSGFIFL
jgi:hypothetical protein